MKILAGSALLRSFKVIEAIWGDLSFGDIFSSSNNWCIGSAITSQNPNVLSLEEEEEGFAWIDNWVFCVVCLKDTVVPGSEQEEADLASRTVALGRALDIIYLASVELWVMNFNKSIISEGVLSLNTVSIFEEDALISSMFVPGPKVAVDIEILL